MKNIDLKKEDIKDIGCNMLYMPFDGNGNRGQIHSTDISKNQLVWMYGQLYSAYLKLWNKNSELVNELENLKQESENNIQNCDDSFTEFINALIDKRIEEKLSFDSECVHYSGRYARLSYDKRELGSVCLESYDDY